MSRNPSLLIEKRRQEIIDTFLALFAEKPCIDIHIKAISEQTAFTRATIYNYFKNIDEIFVSAYQQEYRRWAVDLTAILQTEGPLTHGQLADKIAASLAKRENMLRFSMENFHEREKNCRREFIFDHKEAFSRVVDLMHDCFARFCPELDEEEINRRLYIFFPFMHGMYRYIDITPIQDEARRATHLILKDSSVYQLAYEALLQILK